MEDVSLQEDIEKFCARCKTLVPIDNFHKDKGNRDGLKYACKDCVRIYYGFAKDLQRIFTQSAV